MRPPCCLSVCPPLDLFVFYVVHIVTRRLIRSPCYLTFLSLIVSEKFTVLEKGTKFLIKCCHLIQVVN
jgi:hypothetical protein